MLDKRDVPLHSNCVFVAAPGDFLAFITEASESGLARFGYNFIFRKLFSEEDSVVYETQADAAMLGPDTQGKYIPSVFVFTSLIFCCGEIFPLESSIDYRVPKKKRHQSLPSAQG